MILKVRLLVKISWPIKMRELLSKLILSADQASKQLSTHFTTMACGTLHWPNIRVVSTYCRFVKAMDATPIRPIIFPSPSILLNNLFSPSATKTRSTSDKQFPCFSPLLHTISLPDSTSTRTLAECNHAFTQLIHLGPKPLCNLQNASPIYLIILFAFSKANLWKYPSLLVFLHWCISSSCAIPTPSSMFLPAINQSSPLQLGFGGMVRYGRLVLLRKFLAHHRNILYLTQNRMNTLQ